MFGWEHWKAHLSAQRPSDLGHLFGLTGQLGLLCPVQHLVCLHVYEGN